METARLKQEGREILGADVLRVTKEELFEYCRNKFKTLYPDKRIKDISFDAGFAVNGVLIEFTPPLKVNISISDELTSALSDKIIEIFDETFPRLNEGRDKFIHEINSLITR